MVSVCRVGERVVSVCREERWTYNCFNINTVFNTFTHHLHSPPPLTTSTYHLHSSPPLITSTHHLNSPPPLVITAVSPVLPTTVRFIVPSELVFEEGVPTEICLTVCGFRNETLAFVVMPATTAMSGSGSAFSGSGSGFSELHPVL